MKTLLEKKQGILDQWAQLMAAWDTPGILVPLESTRNLSYNSRAVRATEYRQGRLPLSIRVLPEEVQEVENRDGIIWLAIVSGTERPTMAEKVIAARSFVEAFKTGSAPWVRFQHNLSQWNYIHLGTGFRIDKSDPTTLIYTGEGTR